MRVTEISVIAGRTFNHPYESYSNLRPTVSMRATLAEGDDPEVCTKELQAKAEQLVEDHKRAMIQSIQELEEMSSLNQEVQGLETTLKRAQERLNQIRSQHPMLPL